MPPESQSPEAVPGVVFVRFFLNFFHSQNISGSLAHWLRPEEHAGNPAFAQADTVTGRQAASPFGAGIVVVIRTHNLKLQRSGITLYAAPLGLKSVLSYFYSYIAPLALSDFGRRSI